ncbi:MAG: ABC transporter substrate-binding protein [Pseudomonadota bacterium]
MKNKLTTLLSITALCFSTVLSTQAYAKGDTIKIGSFLAVTGGASFLGDPELKTLQMYIDELNEKGGLLGKKIELIHYDTAGNPKKAVNFIKRLVKKDRVDLIIGGSTSGTTLAVAPLVKKFRIPMVSLAGSIKIIEPTQKWLFKVPHTDRMAAAKVFENMKKRGLTKIALISGSGGFDKSGRVQCLALAEKYGITIVADESYGNKDMDMTAQLTKIRSSDAQAIFNFGFGKAPAIVTKNIKQLGIKLPVYQSHGVASKKYIDLAGDAADGVRLPAAAIVVADNLADNDPQKQVASAYKKAYESKYGQVSSFGAHAYDALMIVVEAIKRAKSVDKNAVRNEIEKTTHYIGAGGIFNMRSDDHMGLKLNSFKLLEIVNGNWQIVK